MQTDTNKIIQLQFDKFDMEPHASSGGCYDYVEVSFQIFNYSLDKTQISTYLLGNFRNSLK